MVKTRENNNYKLNKANTALFLEFHNNTQCNNLVNMMEKLNYEIYNTLSNNSFSKLYYQNYIVIFLIKIIIFSCFPLGKSNSETSFQKQLLIYLSR